MKISDAFKDRVQLTRLLDPAGREFVEGDETTRAEARRAWHAHRWTAQVMSSTLEELPRSELAFRRFGIVEHVPSGRLYRLRKDQLPDIEYSSASAFFTDANGVPVLLEPPPGPQTVDEAERRQAARMERRNAPKPRPAWMR